MNIGTFLRGIFSSSASSAGFGKLISGHSLIHTGLAAIRLFAARRGRKSSQRGVKGLLQGIERLLPRDPENTSPFQGLIPDEPDDKARPSLTAPALERMISKNTGKTIGYIDFPLSEPSPFRASRGQALAQMAATLQRAGRNL